MTARPARLDAADFQHGFGRRAVAGITTICELYIGREQDGRGSPRYTHVVDAVTCPLCLSGTKWPAARDVEPTETARRFDFGPDGELVDTYGAGGGR